MLGEGTEKGMTGKSSVATKRKISKSPQRQGGSNLLRVGARKEKNLGYLQGKRRMLKMDTIQYLKADLVHSKGGTGGDENWLWGWDQKQGGKGRGKGCGEKLPGKGVFQARVYFRHREGGGWLFSLRLSVVGGKPGALGEEIEVISSVKKREML